MTEEEKRIAPLICPFYDRCINCGRYVPPFTKTECECGVKFKDMPPVSSAHREMKMIASLECEKLQKQIDNIRHHLTFLYVETTVVLVLYALTMFMN